MTRSAVDNFTSFLRTHCVAVLVVVMDGAVVKVVAVAVGAVLVAVMSVLIEYHQ